MTMTITLHPRHPTPLDILCGLREVGVEVSARQWREALAKAERYKQESDTLQLDKIREAGL